MSYCIEAKIILINETTYMENGMHANLKNSFTNKLSAPAASGKSVLSCVLFLALTLSAFSANAYTHAISTKVGRISTYAPGPGGAANFQAPTGTTFPGCSTSNYVMYRPDNATVESNKSIMAILMMAKLTGKNVTVYYNIDTANQCRYEYVELE